MTKLSMTSSNVTEFERKLEKMQFSCVPVLQGSAEALVRRREMNYHLIASALQAIFWKIIKSRFMC